MGNLMGKIMATLKDPIMLIIGLLNIFWSILPQKKKTHFCSNWE
jgi:hypothetical protein